MNNLAVNNPVTQSLNSTFGSNPEGYLSKLLSTLITALIIIGSVYFLFQLILGAISWIGSGGDKTKTENAKNKITQALIGIVVLIAVFAIVKLVEQIFSVNIIKIDLSPLYLNNGGGQANVAPKP